MKHIRQICTYIPSIKDKYYIAEDGTVLVAHTERRRITVDGQTVSIQAWRKNAIQEIWDNGLSYKTVPNSGGRYILTSKDMVLKKLKTQLSQLDHKNTKHRVFILLYDVMDRQVPCRVHRLVARAFLGETEGLEVHHINEDPLDNHVSNLQIVTPEEHRRIHSGKFND